MLGVRVKDNESFEGALKRFGTGLKASFDVKRV